MPPTDKRKHSYWLEKNQDDSIQLCRATLTPKGWIESGSKRFNNADDARAYLPPGLVRSWPPNYGGTRVIEYWNEANNGVN